MGEEGARPPPPVTCSGRVFDISVHRKPGSEPHAVRNVLSHLAGRPDRLAGGGLFVEAALRGYRHAESCPDGDADAHAPQKLSGVHIMTSFRQLLS